MRFLWRFLGKRSEGETGDPLDVDQVLATGLRDARGARAALEQLNGERRRLERQRKAVDAQFARLTPGRVRVIARSNPGNPQTEAYMLADAMREADAANQQARSDQLAEVENRLQAIDRAEKELRAYLRRVG
jgi:hypothetical protein